MKARGVLILLLGGFLFLDVLFSGPAPRARCSATAQPGPGACGARRAEDRGPPVGFHVGMLHRGTWPLHSRLTFKHPPPKVAAATLTVPDEYGVRPAGAGPLG